MGQRVVHRRNNAAPGIGFLLAGLLILLSAFLPVIDFTVASVAVAGVNVTPKASYNPDPIGLWLWTGGFVFAFGVILLATRIRGLGILWRILAAIPVLIMGAYAAYMWYYLSNPQGADGDKSVGAGIVQGLATGAQDLGLYSVSAGAGLVLLTVAVIVGIVAIFLPSGKSQRLVPAWGAGASGPNTPNPQQQYQPYPPQQYPPSGP